MLTGMPCLERARLLRLYAQATADLSDLVRKLSESVALEREEFDRAWEQCEKRTPSLQSTSRPDLSAPAGTPLRSRRNQTGRQAEAHSIGGLRSTTRS